MSIYDRLPKYHVVEANNLKGLQPGFVMAQTDVAESCTLKEEGANLLANGHLMMAKASSNKVEMDIWSAAADSNRTNPVMFLVFTDPLNTLLQSDKYFVNDLDSENARFVQLIPGDEWTTDIDYANDAKYASVKEELMKHIVELKDITGWFATTKMADGETPAHHYMYLG